ncbi:C45 family autoproteolytic acyltransferase/hydolase [Halomontanus rarus]|uniref:C45 family autoproteolytic acyltransferase/hydolase n=1 Tax=Halomontanus rarus TaxID=3034020 RepID=UPI0023E7CA48|nr:C45 family autoproteolytic acyltransferase/hydolase [Halovivax sp. TS33]
MDEEFRELGRRRGRLQRDAVEWAVDEIDDQCSDADVDLAPFAETAEATLETIPSRHRAAFEGMAAVLDVDRDVYAAYAFAFSDLARALADASGGSSSSRGRSEIGSRTETETRSDGCTNVLVSDSHTTTDGPLAFKNRDIVGRGTRPVAIVEQPAIGPYHGYITVDTCGTVLLYKGANDAGLVAANTHIDVTQEDVGPGEGVRNGTVVRRILEECSTVGEARDLVESYPPQLFTGHSLLLADAEESLLLEVDPIAETVQPVDEPVVARTNHFLESESPVPVSSEERLERARALLADVEGPYSEGDLRRVSTDHEYVPGEYSICRHAGENAAGPEAFGQETTVSASLFEGGEAAVDAAIGYPCIDGFAHYELGGDVPEDLLSGRRWLERVPPIRRKALVQR